MKPTPRSPRASPRNHPATVAPPSSSSSNKEKDKEKVRPGTKVCSSCNQKSPVACKACICGTPFKTRRDDTINTTVEPPAPTVPGRRRTERVKRERPDYFNAMVIETSFTRRRRASLPATGEEVPKKVKRKRHRTVISKEKEEDKAVSDASSNNGEKSSTTSQEEDVFAGVTSEKSLQYSIILAELNRKLCQQNFKPC